MKLIRYAALSVMSPLPFVAVLALTATPAHAQATRTWVSGVGDDANPCSRTAPCKTFAGAISKTAAGGEINCIDQGAYGAVTITKSIALNCVGVTAGVLHSSTNGIVINAAATDSIFIKGLDINGSPPTSPGLNGIRFLAGASLTVEDTVIRGATGAAPNGFGVTFQPSTGAELAMNNVIINGNGSAAAGTGGGILIQPTGVGGNAKVTLTNVRVQANAGVGLKVDTAGNTNLSGITIGVLDSHFDGNGDGISAINAGGTNPVAIMIDRSTLNNNTGAGLIGNGSSMMIRVSNTTITGNVLGLIAFGGAVVSTYGNNRVIGNPTNGVPNNGSFTNAIPTQ
jgi:hypothetical protein